MPRDGYALPRAGRRCSVCGHESRASIEWALARAVPLRVIAQRWQVSKDAARRHREHHLPESLLAALRAERPDLDHEALRAAEGETLLAMFVRIRGRLQHLAAQLADVGSVSLELQTLAQLRATLADEARLLGQVGGPRSITNVLVASPEWLAVRSALIAALAEHPAARLRVAEVLRSIEVPTTENEAIPTSPIRPSTSSLLESPGPRATHASSHPRMLSP